MAPENGTRQRTVANEADSADFTSPTTPGAVTVFERLLEGNHRVELVATEGKPLVMIVVERVNMSKATGYLVSVRIDLTDEEAKALGMALYNAGGGG